MTEFMISGRGTGKTYEAITWARGAGNRYLVVADEQRASNALATDAFHCALRGGMALHPEKIIPFSSIGRINGQTVELAVDDLDALLHQVFRRPVGLVTATGTLHGVREPSANIITTGGC